MGGRKRALERRYAESVSTPLTDTRCSILCIALLLSSVEFYPQTARHNLSHDPAGMHLVHCRILPPECSVDSLSLSLSRSCARRVHSLSRSCVPACFLAAVGRPLFSEFNFFWPCLISQGRKIKNSDFMLPVATGSETYGKKLLRQRIWRTDFVLRVRIETWPQVQVSMHLLFQESVLVRTCSSKLQKLQSTPVLQRLLRRTLILQATNESLYFTLLRFLDRNLRHDAQLRSGLVRQYADKEEATSYVTGTGCFAPTKARQLEIKNFACAQHVAKQAATQRKLELHETLCY